MNTSETYKAGRLELLKTSTLIRRFLERCPVAEIYDKAVRCYDTLIDSIEEPDISKEISVLLNISPVKVKESAETVINILLFNRENDPYLSFGLGRTSPFSEVHRRWKRLIVLYHPDRYQNQKKFEERVKKINEIYEEIRTLQNQKTFRNSIHPVNEIRMPKSSRIFDFKYFRYIPSFILALAVMTALFFLVFFIFNLLSSRPSSSSHKVKEKGIKLIRMETRVTNESGHRIKSLQQNKYRN